MASNRVRPPNSVATRNEDTPDSCDVKGNEGIRETRKMKRPLIAVSMFALAIAMTGCEKVNEKVNDALKSSAAMKLTNEGRNLFIGIMQANVDRESHGQQNVWPRSSEDDGFMDDKDDIAGMQHKSATEYFNVLFDTKGDNSYVSGLEKSVAFMDDRSKWCVAQGVSDGAPSKARQI